MKWLTNIFIGIFKSADAIKKTIDLINKTANELADSSKKSANRLLKDVNADVAKRKEELERRKLEYLREQNRYRHEELIKRLKDKTQTQKRQKPFDSREIDTEERKRDIAAERSLGRRHDIFVGNRQSAQKRESVAKSNAQYKDLYKNIPLFLISKGIMKLYHFTDVRNLSSIIQCNGLYSWYGLKKRNIFTYHSSNDVSQELDLRKQLHNYVRLAFTSYHPMTTILTKEQGRQIVWLEIDLDVACWKGTLYSDRNANDGQVNISKEFEFLKHIDYDVFKKQYRELDPAEKKRYQAEILVENFLPIQYINNLDDLKRRYL